MFAAWRRLMKKALSLFSILPLVFLFCISCGDDPDEDFADSADISDTEALDTDTDSDPADGGDPEPTDDDPADTVSTPECGNKITEAGEVCDGGAKECSEIDMTLTGYATCKIDCSGWDESTCTIETSDSDDTDPVESDDSDPADPEIEIGEPLGEVTVSNKPNGFDGIFFDGPGEDEALIFYPGASIEPTAYSSIMTMLAERGIDCFIIKMPLDYAILGQNKANDIYNNYPDYKKYYLAGHSMGGAMIANYAAGNLDRTSGLFMMAAYPTEDLKSAEFPILFIYGTEDGVLTRSKLETGLTLVPETAVNYEIEGGNHAYFGDYGEQNGDGVATIKPITQQKITVREILKLVR